MNIHTLSSWASNVFYEKYDGFLKEIIPEHNITLLMKQLWYLLETWDRVFEIDQKNQCISIPTLSGEDRDNTYIVWKTRRTKIWDAINAINKDFPFISWDSIAHALIDMVAYTNAYIKQTTKRWIAKLRSLKFQWRNISIPQESKQELTTTLLQNEIWTVLSASPKDIPLYTISDLVEVINCSTLPLKINWFSDEIIIDKLAAMKMSELKAPIHYTWRIHDQKYTLDVIILRFIHKWWKNIEERDFIEKHITKDVKNGDKTELYKYILQNLIKLYYINTEKHLTLKYDDGKDANHERKNIKMGIQFTNEHQQRKKEKNNIVTTYGKREKSHYTSKKRILKSNVNDKRPLDVELIMELWYDKWYATWLYNFIANYILPKSFIDEPTVDAVAYSRNQMHATTIQEFHMEWKTMYFIKSLDRILENYLIDKNHSYNENWTKVSAANRK